MSWVRTMEVDRCYAHTGSGIQSDAYKAIYRHACTFPYASTHTYSPALKHTCAQCLYMCKHTCVHTHIKVHLCIHLHAHPYKSTPLYTPACIHVHMHACVHVLYNTHTCAHNRTHTCTHTHTHRHPSTHTCIIFTHSHMCIDTYANSCTLS